MPIEGGGRHLDGGPFTTHIVRGLTIQVFLVDFMRHVSMNHIMSEWAGMYTCRQQFRGSQLLPRLPKSCDQRCLRLCGWARCPIDFEHVPTFTVCTRRSLECMKVAWANYACLPCGNRGIACQKLIFILLTDDTSIGRPMTAHAVTTLYRNMCICEEVKRDLCRRTNLIERLRRKYKPCWAPFRFTTTSSP